MLTFFWDDYSRFVWISMLRKKRDDSSALRGFLCGTGSEVDVAVNRSDGGVRFLGRFQQLRDEHRMEREITPPYSPQLSGCDERGLRFLEATSCAWTKCDTNPRSILFRSQRSTVIQARHIFQNSCLPEKTNHQWGRSFQRGFRVAERDRNRRLGRIESCAITSLKEINRRPSKKSIRLTPNIGKSSRPIDTSLSPHKKQAQGHR